VAAEAPRLTVEEAYHHPSGHAAVYCKHLGEGDWEVQSVVTTPDHRGKGLQRELWKRVLADADREGACLLLTVGSGGIYKGALSSEQLFHWYERMGFHGLMGGPELAEGYGRTRMERWPGGDPEL
jgi:GNAT superfamily N-acetyltransferase